MGGWAIAVHGGAGVDPNLPDERQQQAKQLLTRCLNIGISALRSSLPAIDVVELVVRIYYPLTFSYYSLRFVKKINQSQIYICVNSIFLHVFFFFELTVLILVVQVRELESDPLFNSGRGSALTANGTVEMEASIMDGDGRRCGAVSGISTVKNPISLARLVMDKSPHSYLGFSGAEEFAKQQVNKLPDFFKKKNQIIAIVKS